MPYLLYVSSAVNLEIWAICQVFKSLINKQSCCNFLCKTKQNENTLEYKYLFHVKFYKQEVSNKVKSYLILLLGVCETFF